MENVLTDSTAPPPGALMRLKQAVWRSGPVAVAGAVPPFDELVRTHQGRVRAFLGRLCQSDAIAEDIAQETFLKARKGLASYRGEGSLASWLLRIAYREFLAQRRKRGVADVLVDNVDDVDDDDGRNRLQPDRTMERDVRRAMRLLSDDERVAVAACFFEDLTHEEAAAALEIPLGTLKSHVARAKEKLRAPLAAYASATSSASSSSEVRHER